MQPKRLAAGRLALGRVRGHEAVHVRELMLQRAADGVGEALLVVSTHRGWLPPFGRLIEHDRATLFSVRPPNACRGGTVEQRRFDLELREARRIIREHNDNPDDFTFIRTRKKRSVGRILSIREYTVTVSRGKVAPVTYEGGRGKNWVVLFAHDLGVHRFVEGTPDGADAP